MLELKLPRIPGRTETLAIAMLPDLHHALGEHATYLDGQSISPEIPAWKSRGFPRNFHPFERSPAGVTVLRAASTVSAGVVQ